MTYNIIKGNKKNDVVVARDISSIESITEVSDMAQTIKELNDDTMKDSFSGIDMKTNLVPLEINGILVVDTLSALRFLPSDISSLTRTKKRISISKMGKGREDIVRIAQGMQDQGQGKSWFNRLGSAFGGNR